MKENVLLSAGQMFTEIPRETWQQHLEQAPEDISKMLDFMTDAHHLVRNFVVRELPRVGKHLSPGLVSRNLTCHYKSVFFWSGEHAREHLSKAEQVKGLYLTLDQAVYSIPISQGALFAFNQRPPAELAV